MLAEQIQSDLRQAQLARDEVKVSTLRLLISEINNAKIAKGENLTDQEVTVVIQKEVKKRKEAAAGFRQGGREDLATKEETESKVLESYLPDQLSNEELTNLVKDSITELGATSALDMGKVMSAVMGKVAGRADGTTVSSIVRDQLSSAQG